MWQWPSRRQDGSKARNEQICIITRLGITAAGRRPDKTNFLWFPKQNTRRRLETTQSFGLAMVKPVRGFDAVGKYRMRTNGGYSGGGEERYANRTRGKVTEVVTRIGGFRDPEEIIAYSMFFFLPSRSIGKREKMSTHHLCPMYHLALRPKVGSVDKDRAWTDSSRTEHRNRRTGKGV